METIGKLSAAVYRNMQVNVARSLEGLNMRAGQYDFFYVIALQEGLSQKELSTYLHIGKSTTAKAVKHLVNMDYIRREKDAVDHRVDHLYLTELGRQILPQVRQTFEKNIADSVQGLSEQEHNQLLALLGRVLQNLVEVNAKA